MSSVDRSTAIVTEPLSHDARADTRAGGSTFPWSGPIGAEANQTSWDARPGWAMERLPSRITSVWWRVTSREPARRYPTLSRRTAGAVLTFCGENARPAGRSDALAADRAPRSESPARRTLSAAKCHSVQVAQECPARTPSPASRAPGASTSRQSRSDYFAASRCIVRSPLPNPASPRSRRWGRRRGQRDASVLCPIGVQRAPCARRTARTYALR